MKKWTKERDAFLAEFYPINGKKWCVDAMGMTEPQVRSRASLLKLSAKNSNAVKKRIAEQGDKARGKKRPGQAEVMRRNHAEGKMIQSHECRVAAAQVRSERFKDGTLIHPRGYLGFKHGEETRKKIGAKSKAAWDRMSDEERDRRAMTASKNARMSTEGRRKKASWKAAWREIGRHRKYFRSRWEANYARYLEWQLGQGMISDWEHEPETFWFDGIMRGVMSYLPDFRVTNLDGSIEFHEVKGWMDSRSVTTIKRMAKYHPNVRLVVIGAPRYNAIAKAMSRIVPGWE